MKRTVLANKDKIKVLTRLLGGGKLNMREGEFIEHLESLAKNAPETVLSSGQLTMLDRLWSEHCQ